MAAPNHDVVVNEHGQLLVLHFEKAVTNYNVGYRKNGLLIPNLKSWGKTGYMKVKFGLFKWSFPCHRLYPGVYRIGKGWASFVGQMGLDDGDILVFDLADENLVLDVPHAIPIYDIQIRREDPSI